MALVVIITGSPAEGSRTLQLAEDVGQKLAGGGFALETINVRELPAEDLLHARFESPAIKAALALVERADGVVIASPVYKAAYTGVLKAFLDLLPQLGLTGKTVLPLLTGGTLAHVLALDYGLRPVLQSLNPRHIAAGLFVLDKLIARDESGAFTLEPEIAARLDGLVSDFAHATRRLRTEARVG